MSKSNTDPITEAAIEYYNGNAQKNDGAKIEKKAKSKLEKLVLNGEVAEVQVNDGMKLVIAWKDVPAEEVDAKKLLKENPDLFWALCSIPVTALTDELGIKGAAKLMQPVTKHMFKIEKIKTRKS